MGRKLSPIFHNFVESATDAWDGRWDYSKAVFVTTKDKVVITCKIHGDFNQTPWDHLVLKKVGCPLCSGLLRDAETFLRAASFTEFYNAFDYSRVVYVNTKTKIHLRCLIHNKDFTQVPSLFLTGAKGCPVCKVEARSLRPSPIAKKTTQQFLEQLSQSPARKDRDYSKIEYTGVATSVIIACKEHGEYKQKPQALLKGQEGCHPCHIRNITGKKKRLPPHNKMSPEQWVARAKAIWGDVFDYSSTNYVRDKVKVDIICPLHGVFTQDPRNHVNGVQGCPSCKPASSRGQRELGEFLSSLGVDVQVGVRGLLSNRHLEIDFYIENLKVGFEFNGIYFHSEVFKDKDYHANKRRLCEEAGIRLIQIWEDDWLYKPQIIRHTILSVIGMSPKEKVSARDGKVREISIQEAQSFLDEYHIQGYVPASVYLGLFIHDSLVSVMSIKRYKDNFVLSRYATSCIVRGGHSKMVRFVESNYKYHQLETFADLAYSDGGLYEKTGWVKSKVLSPDYTYLKSGKRVHKFNYRKSRFSSDPSLHFETGMTERELAKLNGLHRVYDAGKAKYVKPHPRLDT